MRKKKVDVKTETQETNHTGETLPPDQTAAQEIVEVIPLEEKELPVQTEDIETLKNELQAAQAKAAEYLEGWQRSQAEFANYKRRMEREQLTAGQIAAGNIIKNFLDVIDDLDRALKNRPQDGEGADWANGIELVYRKFLNALEAQGIKRIEAEGMYFDPNLHEAISHEDHPDLESGKVIGVVQQGFAYGDRVLRPARVRVAR